MKSASLHLCLILFLGSGMDALALGGPRAQPVGSSIPSVLYEINEPDRPVFFRLEALERPNGSVDLEKLPVTVRRHLETPREPTGGCIPILPPLLDFIASYRPSLEEALASSYWVFVAEVRALAVGLEGKTPGTLLQVVPSETLKGPSLYGPEYIFMPIAEFQLGGQAFCTSDPEYAPLPEVGDRVLLLVNGHPDNRRTVLRTGAYTGIILLPADEAIGLPARYKKSNPRLVGQSPEPFLTWVRRTLAEGGAR